MKLTNEQIHQLYTFTQKHYVEFYDVQTELVDHLANDIEAICKEEPRISFEKARDMSFKKFGIFGFNEIVGQKQKELTKHYWRLTWKFFKTYFKLPKILLTLFLIGLTYLFLDASVNKILFVQICFGFYAIIPMAIAIIRHFQLKKRHRVTGKKWLFENTTVVLGGYLFISQLPLQFFSFKDALTFTQSTHLLFAITIALLGVLLYILIKIIPEKLEEYYVKQYPEFKLFKKA